MPQILLSVKETAHALGMSPQTVYNLISLGDPNFLTPRYRGDRPMFLATEVLEYAQNLPTKKRRKE